MVINDQVNQYRNWTKCRWERMSDGSYCRYGYNQIIGTEKYEVRGKCVGLDDHGFFGDTRLYWGKGNHYCGLNINPTSVKDRGDWRCSLEFEDPGDETACIAEATVRAKVTMLMPRYETFYLPIFVVMNVMFKEILHLNFCRCLKFR